MSEKSKSCDYTEMIMGKLTGKTFHIEKLDDDTYEWTLWEQGCSLTMNGEEFRDIVDTLSQYVLEGLVKMWKNESDSGCN